MIERKSVKLFLHWSRPFLKRKCSETFADILSVSRARHFANISVRHILSLRKHGRNKNRVFHQIKLVVKLIFLFNFSHISFSKFLIILAVKIFSQSYFMLFVHFWYSFFLLSLASQADKKRKFPFFLKTKLKVPIQLQLQQVSVDVSHSGKILDYHKRVTNWNISLIF